MDGVKKASAIGEGNVRAVGTVADVDNQTVATDIDGLEL